MSTGRKISDEVLRVIDSLQLTAKHQVATPVNWKVGEDVIITSAVSNEEAEEISFLAIRRSGRTFAPPSSRRKAPLVGAA